ncbi:hypothetical protein Bca4012_035064 [Brassica carinata]|uniref:RING-type domain-containing protein n=1 Tax=Brassica carinata TaxID=52824 RepID=A0A8X8B6H0_BRACI|nr:hypothetical protein Bca52824_008942 [Brassica carinata]
MEVGGSFIMEEVTCVICHDQMNLGVNTNCDHQFCGECILGWLTHCLVNGLDSLRCPICRVRVTHLHTEEEDDIVAHLTVTHNELYANHEELKLALLTGVRDIMVASGQSVNHIDAMIQNAQGPAVGIGQDDIGMIQVYAFLFVAAAIVTSHLVRWT